MKIFLTGGSGFVGGHLIPFLVQQNHSVFALARSFGAAHKIQALGAQPVMGDLNGSCTLIDTLQQMDAVVHAAAYLDFTYHKSKYYAMNVGGTQILLNSAKAAGVKKFVYISAASVINGEPVKNIDETYEPTEMPMDYYSRTKLMAEKIVLEANSDTFQTLALRPPFIWAERNPMLSKLLKGKNAMRWMWIGNGENEISTIHVQNLNAAVAAALQSEIGGQAYFVTDGESLQFHAFCSALLRSEGISVSDASIPRWLAMFLANRFDWLWGKFRLKTRPPITPFLVNLFGSTFTLDDSKARNELHYANAITIQQGLGMLLPPEPKPEIDIESEEELAAPVAVKEIAPKAGVEDKVTADADTEIIDEPQETVASTEDTENIKSDASLPAEVDEIAAPSTETAQDVVEPTAIEIETESELPIEPEQVNEDVSDSPAKMEESAKQSVPEEELDITALEEVVGDATSPQVDEDAELSDVAEIEPEIKAVVDEKESDAAPNEKASAAATDDEFEKKDKE